MYQSTKRNLFVLDNREQSNGSGGGGLVESNGTGGGGLVVTDKRSL